ncbi:hypothetical protein D3C72_2320930 [compost metagenome]
MLLISLAVLARWNSGQPGKDPVEMVFVGEAGKRGDFMDFQTAVCQKFLGLIDPEDR